MASLSEQWRDILDVEPSDWSHLALELRLDDPERMEEGLTAMSPLNPWRLDDDFRSGVVRFIGAHSAGYGAAPELIGSRMALLDEKGIGGSMRVIRSLDAARLVATQGPRY